MSQIFHPSTNTFSKVSLFGALFAIAGIALALAAFARSSYVTEVDVVRDQPVQFSHEHHVSGLGIDCRYCHESVEYADFAGMPSTQTCMTCHSQIWTDAPALEPVRESWSAGIPIAWTRVHNLPEYVYFRHGNHVQNGIGCDTCHGPVHEMPLMWKENTLYMEWCLDCHREPERYIRPREEVFNPNWVPPVNQLEIGRQLVAEYELPLEVMLDCSTCHH